MNSEVNNTEWFPTNYHPNLTTDDWISLLNDKSIFNEKSLKVVKRFYDIGGQATCTQLANKYGFVPQFYNSVSNYLAKRVHERTNCPVLLEKDSKYWPILYFGKWADEKDEGCYIWKLRPELYDAISQVDLEYISLYEK